VALWKVHRAKVVASAEAELGGGRKSLEKASLVQVLRWHLGEIGIYEAMLEWSELTINVSFSWCLRLMNIDEFEHLFELGVRRTKAPHLSWELLPPRTKKRTLSLSQSCP
jgi:hypothetical protein